MRERLVGRQTRSGGVTPVPIDEDESRENVFRLTFNDASYRDDQPEDGLDGRRAITTTHDQTSIVGKDGRGSVFDSPLPVRGINNPHPRLSDHGVIEGGVGSRYPAICHNLGALFYVLIT
jgi:hypothetical protein